MLFSGTNLGAGSGNWSQVTDSSGTITNSQTFVLHSPSTGILPYAIGSTSSGMD